MKWHEYLGSKRAFFAKRNYDVIEKNTAILQLVWRTFSSLSNSKTANDIENADLKTAVEC